MDSYVAQMIINLDLNIITYNHLQHAKCKHGNFLGK
jgi:hypothetical protein